MRSIQASSPTSMKDLEIASRKTTHLLSRLEPAVDEADFGRALPRHHGRTTEGSEPHLGHTELCQVFCNEYPTSIT